MTKYIFDFDDVLFFNTEKFKKYMYKCFEDVGVDYDTVKKYYKIEREKGWVLYNLVISVLEGENITTVSKEELAEKIMKECINFINDELPPRPKEWRWTEEPCKWNPYKKLCKQDHKDGVVKLSESNAVKFALEHDPSYNIDKIRKRVTDRWQQKQLKLFD